MRKVLVVVLCAMALLCSAQLPQKQIKVDLPALLDEVDKAIDESPKFVSEQEDKIEQTRKTIATAESDNQRLLLFMQLCQPLHQLHLGLQPPVQSAHALLADSTLAVGHREQLPAKA